MGILQKYMVRVHHMKHMRAEIRKLQVSRHHLARRMEAAQEEALEMPRLRGRLQRWRAVAVAAVLVCPGSFVAGGLLLERLLKAWW